MASIARMAALHSALWGFDRYYRMAWYVWPAALGALIAGWICVDKAGPPSSSASASAGNWAQPVASTPNFPVGRSPVLANWPEKLQNEATTCFSNPPNMEAATMATLQPMIDACTRIIESGQVNDVQMVNGYGRRGNLLHVVQPDRALADFESALRIQPNAAGILVERAKVYVTRHESDDAMADLNKAIELYPPAQAGVARHYRGLEYLQRKDYEHGMEDLNEALKYMPDNPDLYLSRGEGEMAQKQYDAALRDFDEFSKRAPRRAIGLIRKSAVLEATSRIPEALSVLDTAIAIEPTNQGALTARDKLRIKQAAAPAPQAKPDNNKH
jgi:tetratricopeptide (TPR) repeat protein